MFAPLNLADPFEQCLSDVVFKLNNTLEIESKTGTRFSVDVTHPVLVVSTFPKSFNETFNDFFNNRVVSVCVPG
jgi:hypothetical protein